MTDPQLGMLMLGLFIFIIMLGFPIAFTLMAMGVSFGYYAYYTAGQDFFQNRVFTLLVQKTFEVTSSDVLVAVPLFLFMGYLVERANILDRLFYSLQLSMKNVPGALAVATLITCAMFATATGIVGAVVTLMGLLALPAMLRAGYDTKLSAGVVCAGGCLGILIPPSILLIVYAATAGVSAVKLYAAAFIPGFLLAGLYVVYVIVRAMINPALAPKLPPEQYNVPFSTVLWALATSFLPLALLIVSVLGAILFGLATPSEAAAVGAVMSIVLAAAYGSLNYEMMRESVYLTVRATAMVCYLFIGSWTFSAVFAVLGGQTVVEQFFASMNLSPLMFLLLTQVIIFLLGWPLEWTEIIIIFVPIFLPLLPTYGVDPIFFGILVALNTQTAFNTPPVAMAAFYLKGVAPPQVKLTDIFSGALPFVGLVFLTMALVYIFPGLALWLPDYLYGNRLKEGAHEPQCARPGGGCGRHSRRPAQFGGAGRRLPPRIDEVDREIDAWAFLDRDHAMWQAEAADDHRKQGKATGPLHGVPVGIKDIFDTGDMPTEFGSKLWAGRTPRRDAAAVARLRAAGAVILGKTVTTEYAYFNPGKTRNPHNPDHTPGGSSSGSAAAVAALQATNANWSHDLYMLSN